MEPDAKIYVAGHQGLVGGAIWRRLQTAGFKNLAGRSLEELDLRDQAAVTDFFGRERPEYVCLAAARVGGIRANATFPADFIYDNLMIQTNIIHQAYQHDVKKLLFLGSSCIYPRLCPQPMKEDYFLDGKLEPTNEPYAVAKSPASRCASLITASTALVSSRRCPPISTVRETILTCWTPTSSPP